MSREQPVVLSSNPQFYAGNVTSSAVEVKNVSSLAAGAAWDFGLSTEE